jgi:hypothetical protein
MQAGNPENDRREGPGHQNCPLSLNQNVHAGMLLVKFVISSFSARLQRTIAARRSIFVNIFVEIL